MGTIKKIIKTETGLAMPLVLMVMVVLTLLGTALWQYSLSDLKQSIHEENKMRAHYLARAGAESIARHIMRFPGEVDDFFTDNNEIMSNPLFLDIRLSDDEEFYVKLKNNSDDDIIEITGLGRAGGLEKEVIIIMEKNFFDGVIYSLGNMEFSDVKEIIGDVVSGGTIIPIPLSGHIGEIFTDTEIIFPDESNYNEPTSYEENFSGDSIGTDVVYNIIEVGNHKELIIKPIEINTSIKVEANEFKMDIHGKLVIDTKGQVVQIYANKYVLRNLTVIGGGTAEIHVIENGTLNLQTKYGDVSVEGDDTQLIVYLEELSTMELQANDAYFDGYVYGPNATVKMGNNTHFSGAMIVGQLMDYGGGNKGKIGGPQTNINQKYKWSELEGYDLGYYYKMYYWSD